MVHVATCCCSWGGQIVATPLWQKTKQRRYLNNFLDSWSVSLDYIFLLFVCFAESNRLLWWSFLFFLFFWSIFPVVLLRLTSMIPIRRRLRLLSSSSHSWTSTISQICTIIKVVQLVAAADTISAQQLSTHTLIRTNFPKNTLYRPSATQLFSISKGWRNVSSLYWTPFKWCFVTKKNKLVLLCENSADVSSEASFSTRRDAQKCRDDANPEEATVSLKLTCSFTTNCEIKPSLHSSSFSFLPRFLN